MSQDISFDDWMARLQAGDPDAALRVFNRFAERLIALARSRLDAKLRQKVDPEDVLQSAYKSFFVRQAQGQFHLESWDNLWSILTVITLRKCGKWADHFHAEKRDVGVEVGHPVGPDGSRFTWQAVADEPTPLEAAMLADTVELLLKDLEGREREMVVLSLQGEGIPEISVKVGRTRRTVQRVLKRIKEKLQEMQGETR